MTAPLRVGLVGAGAIARPHAAAWRERGSDVAVFSTQGAARLADRYGLTVAATLDDVIASSDVVDIVSPSGSHAALALRAIEAGRHVVCEKPLALSSSDAHAVAEAAARRGVLVLPAHVGRFSAVAAIRRAIERGRIGDVAVARFERTAAAPAADSWYADASASGGVEFDLMIHDLDLARWLCGDVVTVYATGHRAAVAGSLVSSAQAILTHASGAISTVSATWAPPGTEFRFRMSVAGSGGTLTWDSRSANGLDLDVPGLPAGDALKARGRAAPLEYRNQIAHFHDVIRGVAVRPRVTIEDGVSAVALAEAVQRSQLTGEPVSPDSVRTREDVA